MHYVTSTNDSPGEQAYEVYIHVAPNVRRCVRAFLPEEDFHMVSQRGGYINNRLVDPVEFVLAIFSKIWMSFLYVPEFEEPIEQGSVPCRWYENYLLRMLDSTLDVLGDEFFANMDHDILENLEVDMLRMYVKSDRFEMVKLLSLIHI